MVNIFNQIIQGLTDNFPTIVFVIAVTYLSVLLNSVQTENKEKTELVSLAVICIGTVPIIKDLSGVIMQTKDTVGEVQVTMTSVVSSLASMNLSGDNVSGVTFFLLTEVIITLLNKVFLPMILIYAALGICGAISDKFNLTGVKNAVRGFFTGGLLVLPFIKVFNQRRVDIRQLLR